jgi:polysaccharide pyruvyl transferase WcaK-like protein
MNICVLGWYGTETLGDRAILDGICVVFSKTYGKAHVRLGSLNPFVTHRTMVEDGGIYAQNAPGISLSCFDVKNAHALRDEIKKADMVLMGGGPIMDLDELNIVCYAFHRARKLKKRTMVFGCGLGPLYQKRYEKVAERILGYADDIVFRDRLSSEMAVRIFGGGNYRYAFDPAVLSVGEYVAERETGRGNGIAVNLRDFPASVYGEKNRLTFGLLKGLFAELSARFGSVVLVPMHTFGVGGDDRRFFAELLSDGGPGDVRALHTPPNLHELYGVFSDSFGCIGMRYHSVLMQTFLNGNNVVFDYTEKGVGKIGGFLDMLGDAGGFYESRYWNIQEEPGDGFIGRIPAIFDMDRRFAYNRDIYGNTLDFYMKLLN